MNLRRRLCLSLPFLAMVKPSFSQAPGWPRRSLQLVVPYGPGGPTDILARLVAPVLSELLR